MRITDKLGFIKNFLFTLIICSSLSLTASCQTKVQTAAELVKSCQTFLDKDDLEGASECYEKLLFANPKRADEISKASAEAIYCFESVTELMPNSANVQFNLADSYYEYFKKNGNIKVSIF